MESMNSLKTDWYHKKDWKKKKFKWQTARVFHYRITMTHRPQIPAEVNRPQRTELAPLPHIQNPQFLLRRTSAAPGPHSTPQGSCPAKHRTVGSKSTQKGAVIVSLSGWSKSQRGGTYLPHYLNYSPMEVNAFSPVNRCSGTASHETLSSLTPGVH